MRPLRRKLAVEISGLDALVEFAATETAEVAPLRDTLRTSLAAMFGVLVAAASVHDALRRAGEGTRADTELAQVVADSLSLLSEIDAGLDIAAPRAAAARLTVLYRRLFLLGERVAAGLDPTDLPLLVAHDRLAELLDELRVGLAGMIALQAGRPVVLAEDATGFIRHPSRLGVHLDWRAGLINGVRAGLAVWIAGALWILSGWPYGWMMVTMVVPNAGLLALRDRPEVDSVDFIKGCTAAVVMGWISLVYLLPLTDSFAGLCLVVGPCLFLGSLLAANPKAPLLGVGISVFYLTLLTPTNPMVYDANLYLNTALPTIGGAILTMLVFRLVFPGNPRGRVRAMVRTMQRDIQALLASRDVTPIHWETRMHDRMVQLIARMRVADMRQDWLMRGGFASLRIGREIIRARRLLADFADDRLVDSAMAPSRQALRHLAMAPAAAVQALPVSAARLLALAVGERGAASPALARVAASLLEIAVLIGNNRRFFQTATPGSPRSLAC